MRAGLRSSAQVDDRSDAQSSGPARTAASVDAAEAFTYPKLFHPAVAGWFARAFRAPSSGPGRRLACDQGKAAYADRRADRLRQDARRLSRRDRRPRPAGSGGRARERGAGGLRVAAQGALERHPQESRGAARRHKARARARGISRRRDPHPRPDGRHGRQRARPHAPQPAAYPRDDARVALRAARLRVGARKCWRRRGR